MELLKKIFDFYIFSNIHVSLTAASLVMISRISFNKPVLSVDVFFVFFSTLLAYHFIRVFESCTCSYKAVEQALKKQKYDVILLGIFALLATTYFAIKISYIKLLILIPSVLLMLWYAIPLFYYKGKRISLRNYPSIKIVSIAIVWAINTAIFPLQDDLNNINVWLHAFQYFFLIFVWTIPFDIRDMYEDPEHLYTLPQIIGIQKSKVLGIVFALLSIIISLFERQSGYLYIEMIIIGLSIIMLLKARQHQNRYYAAFWVESIPIIWLGFLLIST